MLKRVEYSQFIFREGNKWTKHRYWADCFAMFPLLISIRKKKKDRFGIFSFWNVLNTEKGNEKIAVRSHPHVLITNSLVIIQAKHRTGEFSYWHKRMGTQLSCVLISKHTKLGNFCSAWKKERNWKEIRAERGCIRDQSQKEWILSALRTNSGDSLRSLGELLW